MKKAANSEALRNWNDLKKRCKATLTLIDGDLTLADHRFTRSLSRSTGAEEAIFAVSGVASVLGAVGAGGLVLPGIVSGPMG